MTPNCAAGWKKLQSLSAVHAAQLGVRPGGTYRHRTHTPPEVIRENCEILGRGDETEIKNRIHWYLTFHPEVFDPGSKQGGE